MKKYLTLIALICLTTTLVMSQAKKKQKDDEPSLQELQEMMKQAQKEMEGLDPEAKRMMDSMGVAMPVFNMPHVSEAELKQAYEDKDRVIPRRNDAAIASIPKTPLTNATLPAFLSSTHNGVTTRIKSASKTKGEEIYKSLKTQYNSATATGNSAAALWMMGKSELALYVMGRACMDKPTDAANLNNYATMLCMTGGESLSVPILDHLNKRYPGNTTILNNLGQAWFGLGEIDKANTYLENVIRIYAYHPQANYTKSFIEQSKGQQSKAIEAVKRSVKNAFTPEKQTRLDNLGYKLKGDDLSWNHPMPQDALGLSHFTTPAYPTNIAQSKKYEQEWEIFKQQCRAEIANLKAAQQRLEAEMIEANGKRVKQIMQAGTRGVAMNPLPPFAPKASVKLKHLIEGPDGQIGQAFERNTKALVKAKEEVIPFDDQLSAELQAIQKEYEDQFGEGKPNPIEKVCRLENEATDKYLKNANTLLEKAHTDYLNFMRRMIGDELYYYQYTMWPEDFEVTKAVYKIRWLTLLQDLTPVFRQGRTDCKPADAGNSKSSALAAFDDVHCEYHSEFKTLVGTIRTDCSRMTTELDLKFLKLGLKQDMDKETFGDQFMSCSVEVAAGAGAGVDAGPLKAEASIGGAIAAEFDRTGLKDVIIKTSASASVDSNLIKGGKMAGVGVSDLSLDVGVQGQISLISGTSSFGGTGILSGLR